MVRALYRTLKWVHAGDGARLAAAIADYFPLLPQPRLASALARYQALGIWGRDCHLPRSGFERLKAGLLSGGLIATAAPYERVVDNSLADLVASQEVAPLTQGRASL